MKSLIFSILLFRVFFSSSQSVSYLPAPYTEILIHSISFSYSYDNTYSYSRPSFSYGDVLSTLQARYDANLATISKEYNKLKDLELINKHNKTFLLQYKNQRLPWVKNSLSYDLGQESITQQILANICEIYSIPSIKNEIRLLQKCNYEIMRIQYEDPNDYPTSKRYQSISKVLEKLSTCKENEIEGLNWEYFEIQEKAISESKENAKLKVYVKSSTINVRNGASTTSPIIVSLKKGAELEVIEKVGDWYKVKANYDDVFSQTPNLTTGYVLASLTTLTDPNAKVVDAYDKLISLLAQDVPSTNTTVTQYTGQVEVYSYAAIYEKPDRTNSRQIGFAENNTVVILRNATNSYYYVQSGSVKGYMHMSMIKK